MTDCWTANLQTLCHVQSVPFLSGTSIFSFRNLDLFAPAGIILHGHYFTWVLFADSGSIGIERFAGDNIDIL